MKYIINTLLLGIVFLFISTSCGVNNKIFVPSPAKTDEVVTSNNLTIEPIKTGADNFESYLSLLKGKKIGIVSN